MSERKVSFNVFGPTIDVHSSGDLKLPYDQDFNKAIKSYSDDYAFICNARRAYYSRLSTELAQTAEALRERGGNLTLDERVAIFKLEVRSRLASLGAEMNDLCPQINVEGDLRNMFGIPDRVTDN